jgi:hypothetical protein
MPMTFAEDFRPFTAAATPDASHIRHGFHNLQPECALPRDDGRIIERWNHQQPFVGHKPLRLDLRLVLTVADDTDFSTQPADFLHLVGRHQFRHADHGAHAFQPRRMGQRPSMIAGGCGHNAARLVCGVQ